MKKDESWNILHELERGTLRCASYDESAKCWIPNPQAKEQIVDLFRQSSIVSCQWPPVEPPFFFQDKSPFILESSHFDFGGNQRIVPGGTSIRPGVFLGAKVIVMPPSFINVGAYIGEATMVDSHVLVGSCAQIGARVHLSAHVMIGGVLEPANSRPVIIEDDVFIGAKCALAEGALVKKSAILGMGVHLASSIPVYDLVHGRKVDFEEGIPEGAIVIPGNRSLDSKSAFARDLGLSSYCALIVKYSDGTNPKVQLEQALREQGR